MIVMDYMDCIKATRPQHEYRAARTVLPRSVERTTVSATDSPITGMGIIGFTASGLPIENVMT